MTTVLEIQGNENGPNERANENVFNKGTVTISIVLVDSSFFFLITDDSVRS